MTDFTAIFLKILFGIKYHETISRDNSCCDSMVRRSTKRIHRNCQSRRDGIDCRAHQLAHHRGFRPLHMLHQKYVFKDCLKLSQIVIQSICIFFQRYTRTVIKVARKKNVYMLSNIIRRFLEIYTRIKLPGNHDEVDNRIKIIMGENVNELKILHYFSHFTTLERVTKHSDIIMRLPEITEDLFKLVRRDKAHLDFLIEGIK